MWLLTNLIFKKLHTTKAIIHCFGIFCRKFLPFPYIWFTAENPRGFSRNETIAKPLGTICTKLCDKYYQLEF